MRHARLYQRSFLESFSFLDSCFVVCLQVNDDRTVKVVFVDYGNVEDCKATEMRKNVYMGHIPVQCYKCVLDGVIPVSRKIY